MRSKKEIIFPIGKNEKIKLFLTNDIPDTHRYDEVKIILQTGNDDFILYNNDFIIEAIRVATNLMQKALKNDLGLHSSIIGEEIGLLSNRLYMNEVSMLVFENGFWVGDRNLLWQTHQNTSWLYNKGNKIFFEVTPIFEGCFEEDEYSDSRMAYEEFKRNYSPIYIAEIKMEYIIQWQFECNEIMRAIERTDNQ